MNNTGRNVLACLDGSMFNDAVIDYAVWGSRALQSPLKLLHTLDQRPVPPPNLSGNIGLGAQENILKGLVEQDEQSSRLHLEQGHRMLQQARDRAISLNAIDPTISQRRGPLVDSLTDLEHEIGLLVMGIRGEDHEPLHHQPGHQLEAVIRALHCPVLVVNRPFPQTLRQLMLAYEGGDASRRALSWIGHSPLFAGMHCHIVHVSDDPNAAETLLNEAEAELAEAGMQVTTAGLRGDTGQVLRHYQDIHSIDIMAMGAFSHSRMRELLFGSTTLKLLGSSRIPLVLLR